MQKRLLMVGLVVLLLIVSAISYVVIKGQSSADLAGNGLAYPYDMYRAGLVDGSDEQAERTAHKIPSDWVRSDDNDENGYNADEPLLKRPPGTDVARPCVQTKNCVEAPINTSNAWFGSYYRHIISPNEYATSYDLPGSQQPKRGHGTINVFHTSFFKGAPQPQLDITIEPVKLHYDPGEKITLNISQRMPVRLDKVVIPQFGVNGSTTIDGSDSVAADCVANNYQYGTCMDERKGRYYPHALSYTFNQEDAKSDFSSSSYYGYSANEVVLRATSEQQGPTTYVGKVTVTLPKETHDIYRLQVLTRNIGLDRNIHVVPWYSNTFAIGYDLKATQTGFAKPDDAHNGAVVQVKVTEPKKPDAIVGNRRLRLAVANGSAAAVEFASGTSSYQPQLELTSADNSPTTVLVRWPKGSATAKIDMTDVESGLSITRTLGFPEISMGEILYDAASPPPTTASLFNFDRAKADEQSAPEAELLVPKGFLDFLNDPETPPNITEGLILDGNPKLADTPSEVVTQELSIQMKTAGGAIMPAQFSRLSSDDGRYDTPGNRLSWDVPIPTSSTVGSGPVTVDYEEESQILLNQMAKWVPNRRDKLIAGVLYTAYAMKVDLHTPLDQNSRTRIGYNAKSGTLVVGYQYTNKTTTDRYETSAQFVQSNGGPPSLQINFRLGSGKAVDPKVTEPSIQTFRIDPREQMRIRHGTTELLAKNFPSQLRLQFVPVSTPTIEFLRLRRFGGDPLGEKYTGKMGPGNILDGRVRIPSSTVDHDFSLITDPNLSATNYPAFVLESKVLDQALGLVTDSSRITVNVVPTTIGSLAIPESSSVALETNTPFSMNGTTPPIPPRSSAPSARPTGSQSTSPTSAASNNQSTTALTPSASSPPGGQLANKPSTTTSTADLLKTQLQKSQSVSEAKIIYNQLVAVVKDSYSRQKSQQIEQRTKAIGKAGKNKKAVNTIKKQTAKALSAIDKKQKTDLSNAKKALMKRQTELKKLARQQAKKR